MSRDFRPLRGKTVIKRNRVTEAVSSSMKKEYTSEYEKNKENILVKESLVSQTSVVKKLKISSEELSVDRASRAGVDETQNVQKNVSTGAIKKRTFLEVRVNYQQEKKISVTKVSRTGDDESVNRSHFEIYTDDAQRNTDWNSKLQHEKKSICPLRNVDVRNSEFCPPLAITDKRLNQLRLTENKEKFESRATPVDFSQIPPALEKVKIAHKHQFCIKSDKPVEASAISPSENDEFTLPYNEYLLNQEFSKEAAAIARKNGNLHIRNVTSQQRKIILKFLTRLHTHLFLPSHFLYQTVRIFDAVLDAKNIKVEDLQLFALAAMWIALKREHTVYDIPTADKMVAFAGDLYQGKKNLLIKCEIDILTTLNFNITFPDPFTIVCYNITKSFRFPFMKTEDIHLAYCCGSYLIDLTLFDENMMEMPVILLAAAVAETALYFAMEEVEDTVEPCWYAWRSPDMARRYSDKEIGTVRDMLMRKTFESHKRHSDVEIIYKKYIRSRYGRISYFLGNKVKKYLREE